jgi:transcriptional regulator with XRE-family HTH domain
LKGSVRKFTDSGEFCNYTIYIYLQRKKEDKKAVEVADYLGLSESAYTKYERGESKITIDIIQKVAEFYHIDPLNLLAMPAGSFIDSGNNSPGAIVGNNNVQTVSNEQMKLITRLIETQITMTEKVIVLLAENGKK